jgi:hypothetical protein
MLHRSQFVLVAALGFAACHRDSGSAAPASSINLGLSALRFVGEGDHWLVSVSEAEQGVDLDGDGDLFDEVLHWIDAASGGVRNTGLPVFWPQVLGDIVPEPILAVGQTFAVAITEGPGGVDRNGDGDVADAVLSLIDPESGVATNLGLAVARVAFAGEVLAFDVPELGQGDEDLDGDGVLDPAARVPHFHDLRTGETWSSGLLGATLLGGDESFVSLAESEAKVGDRNGDGDTLDLVLAFYDLATRSLQSAGLALSSFRGVPSTAHAHGGHWAVYVDERAQGIGDLDGDGTLTGDVLFVVDPVASDARVLPGLYFVAMPDVTPFVLRESSGGDYPWLYSAADGRLERLGFACGELFSLGRQLVMTVVEELQGEDLDGNGALDGLVPVLFDPETRLVLNLGVDGSALAAGDRLWILSGEEHARRDWNDDGDRADVVLHQWENSAGRLTNTRLDVGRGDLSRCSPEAVLFLRAEVEQGVDLNRDGDREDLVTHLYDARVRRPWNLGLAADLLIGIGGEGSRAFLLVSEAGQETDLNGDGDALDRVLHLVAP